MAQMQKAIVDKITGKGDVIYITNNVDYINELDKGSNQQAPNGMSKFNDK